MEKALNTKIQAIIDRIKEGSIEEQKIHHGSLDVLAHHLVGLSMQVGNVPIEAALKLTKLAYPFRDISLEEFFDVLEILASVSYTHLTLPTKA